MDIAFKLNKMNCSLNGNFSQKRGLNREKGGLFRSTYILHVPQKQAAPQALSDQNDDHWQWTLRLGVKTD